MQRALLTATIALIATGCIRAPVILSLRCDQLVRATVVVVDAEGRPVAYAHVTRCRILSGTPRDAPCAEQGSVIETLITKTDGTYETTDDSCAVGRDWASVDEPGLHHWWWPEIGRLPLPVGPPPGPRTVSGSVTDPAGHPVAGADVAVPWMCTEWHARTDAGGQFSLTVPFYVPVPKLDVSATGFWPDHLVTSLPQAKPLVLQPVLSIVGRVGCDLVPDGVRHRVVRLYLADTPKPCASLLPFDAGGCAETLTDGTGRFRFDGLRPGDYRLEAGTAHASLRLETREQSVELLMKDDC